MDAKSALQDAGPAKPDPKTVVSPTVTQMRDVSERLQATRDIFKKTRVKQNPFEHVYVVSYRFSKNPKADMHEIYFSDDMFTEDSEQIVSLYMAKVRFQRDQGGPEHKDISISRPHGMVGRYVKKNPHFVPKDQRQPKHSTSIEAVKEFYSPEKKSDVRQFNNIFN